MDSSQSLYMDGAWLAGSGADFCSYDPASGKLLWQGSSAGDLDVACCAAAARAAFGGWSSLTIEERIGYIKTFAAELKSRQQPIAEIISKETGKPLWESKTEVAAVIQKIDISVDAQQQRCGTIEHAHPLGSLITRHRPHGVVAVFGPFNFPAHLPNGHIIPALLAGNTVILKPSELAPWVAEEILRCWHSAGLPKGVINMLQGGHETGRLLLQNNEIDGFFFTGSFSTGQKLTQALAKRAGKILALEMGGNNPLIVDSGTDIPATVYAIIQSSFITSGQRCTCARRLIVHEKAQQLISALLEKTAAIKVGAYTELPEPFMGPVISAQAAKQLLLIQQQLIEQGAKALLPMHLLKAGTGLLSPGIIDVTGLNDLPDEEVFGPLLQITRVQTFEQALVEANKTTYGLAAGLISNSKENYCLFNKSVRAGIINWNTPLTGASSLAPFGGVGRSGNYRPSAYYAADYCNYPVASIEAPFVKLPETMTPGLL